MNISTVKKEQLVDLQTRLTNEAQSRALKRDFSLTKPIAREIPKKTILDANVVVLTTLSIDRPHLYLSRVYLRHCPRLSFQALVEHAGFFIASLRLTLIWVGENSALVEDVVI